MKTSKPPRILPMVLACLMLAAGFVIGSAALTTDAADASPTCAHQQFARQICLQPIVPTSSCLSPYVPNGTQCVAYNPLNSVASPVAWSCPAAPPHVQVSENLLTVGGYTYIFSCSYTSPVNPYLSFRTFNFSA